MLIEIEMVEPVSRPNYLRRCQSSLLQGKPGLVNKTRLLMTFECSGHWALKSFGNDVYDNFIEKQRRVIDLQSTTFEPN